MFCINNDLLLRLSNLTLELDLSILVLGDFSVILSDLILTLEHCERCRIRSRTVAFAACCMTNEPLILHLPSIQESPFLSNALLQGGVIVKKILHILLCAKLLLDPKSKISCHNVASFLGRRASENLGCYSKIVKKNYKKNFLKPGNVFFDFFKAKKEETLSRLFFDA